MLNYFSKYPTPDFLFSNLFHLNIFFIYFYDIFQNTTTSPLDQKHPHIPITPTASTISSTNVRYCTSNDMMMASIFFMNNNVPSARGGGARLLKSRSHISKKSRIGVRSHTPIGSVRSSDPTILLRSH